MTTAGQKLKAARLEKNLSLEDIASSTKIKSAFLEYIEKGEYQKLPSVSYAQGFVRNYAQFLGLDEKEIMALFRREFDSESSYKVLPKGFESEERFSKSKFPLKLRGLVLVGIFLLIFGFILFQYRSAFLNPSLTVSSPKENATISASNLTVKGKTDPDTTVYIDSDEVSVDADGNFSKTINVFPGNITITVKSVNKFQRQTEKDIDINVKGS